jgi:hypothetical protein
MVSVRPMIHNKYGSLTHHYNYMIYTVETCYLMENKDYSNFITEIFLFSYICNFSIESDYKTQQMVLKSTAEVWCFIPGHLVDSEEDFARILKGSYSH